MTQMDRKRARRLQMEKRMDEAARSYVSMEETGNEAARQALYLELFELWYRLFDNTDKSALDAFEEALRRYQPEKGAFSHYLSFLMNRRKTDANRALNSRNIQILSMDAPMGEEDATLSDFIADPSAAKPEERAEWDEALVELTALVLDFSERHRGKAGNETRRNWYRLFFTEDMTFAAKSVPLRLTHERDVFSAMKLAYLDYYMSAPCRDLASLLRTALRPYSETVPERGGEEGETPIPIPADVCLNYLKRCEQVQAGAAARSNQMKFYKEEKERIRHC